MKNILKVFIGVFLISVLTFLYLEFLVLDWNLEMKIGILILQTVLIVFWVWFLMQRPLKIITNQMKFLLTGRKYKKILSKRVDEIGIVAHFFNEVTFAFESVSSQIREGKKVYGELKLAGELQREILPERSPKVNGLELVIKNRSAEELGGDNFDFIVKNNEVFLYLGDVTGHGIPAAIIMTMVNTLLHAFIDVYDSAYQAVVETNKRLKSRIRSTFFMSMVLLKWDIEKKKLSYVGCGHEHILIYRVKTGKCEAKLTGGIALGMIADNSKIIKELELEVEEGDVIVLYTDGITEARNMEGEMFGLERLKIAVEENAGLYSAEGIVDNIAKLFSKFVGEHVQEDDVTLIVMKVNSSGISEVEKKIEWTKEASLNYNSPVLVNPEVIEKNENEIKQI